MVLSDRTKRGIIIAVAVLAGLTSVWLAALLLVLAAVLIAWVSNPNAWRNFLRVCRMAIICSKDWLDWTCCCRRGIWSSRNIRETLAYWMSWLCAINCTKADLDGLVTSPAHHALDGRDAARLSAKWR